MNFWLSSGCLAIARVWGRIERLGQRIEKWALGHRNVWMSRADEVLGPEFADLDVGEVEWLPLYDIEPATRIEHRPRCGANNGWDACTCGLFQGWDKPLASNRNHHDGCPCHCTCDFMDRLKERLSRE